MYQVSTINHSILWTVHYYYVSEYQLPPVIDASHTTPITESIEVLSYWNWSIGPVYTRDHGPESWR